MFEDGNKQSIDGIFIAYDSASAINFALKMGILTQGQAIMTNNRQETNIEGLFAAETAQVFLSRYLLLLARVP